MNAFLHGRPLTMQIGPYRLSNNLIAAPMAGVTDRPFRQLCKAMGAGMAVSEMVTSNWLLYGSAKTRRRADHEGEAPPIWVQIAGADPTRLAEAARYNVDAGAQIIDIKIRTGWDQGNRNALTVARIAEAAGIQALAIYGRTRACMFHGEAEYETIAAVKTAARIPVIANGDIDTPEKAKAVLDATGVDGVMIGRAALGRPWIFREIAHFLVTGRRLPPPDAAEIRRVLLSHLDDMYAFYGDRAGVGITRKHIGWYTKGLPDSAAFLRRVFQIPTVAEQRAAVDQFLAERESSSRLHSRSSELVA